MLERREGGRRSPAGAWGCCPGWAATAALLVPVVLGHGKGCRKVQGAQQGGCRRTPHCAGLWCWGQCPGLCLSGAVRGEAGWAQGISTGSACPGCEQAKARGGRALGGEPCLDPLPVRVGRGPGVSLNSWLEEVHHSPSARSSSRRPVLGFPGAGPLPAKHRHSLVPAGLCSCQPPVPALCLLS